MISLDNPENRDKDFNTPNLSFISEITGGRSYNIDDLDTMEITEEDSIIEQHKFEIPIYKKWYLIALFLIAFCLEIFLRKRWGLL